MDQRHRAAGAYRKTQGLLKSGTPATPPGGTGGTGGADDTFPRSEPTPPRHGGAGTSTEDRRRLRVGDIPTSAPLTAVAQFLTLVGRREAAAVLRRMPRSQADQIVDAMSHVGPISPSDARKVLAQFGARRSEVTHEVFGGPDAAREILVRAFGVEEGERRFYQLLPEERPTRFAFLDDADGRQLSMVLRGESTATVAIVASNVSQATAARLLDALPASEKAQVVRRMASIGTIDATVLEAVETNLRRRLESIDRPEEDAVDGEDRLAQIMRFLDLTTSDEILETLSRNVPDAAENIRRRMTTLEDIFHIDARELQTVLQRVDDVDLAIILKGKPEKIEQRVMANVSERRAEMVRMHRESLGPMRRKDVDRVTGEFMEMVRSMARNGEIVVRHDGEKYV